MASEAQPIVTLYWLEQSRSQRILWLLEELNVPYELKVFHRNKQTNFAPPELKEIHPLGKSPVLTVKPAGAPADQKPIVLAESAVIVEYILEHWGRGSSLVPKQWKEGKENQVGGETEEWLRYRYYMHYAEGSFMPLLILTLFTGRIEKAPVPFFIKPLTRMIAGNIKTSYIGPNQKTHFSFLEGELASSPNNGNYLCGDKILGSDILMSFPLIGARAFGLINKDNYPKLNAYIDRLEAEPGYKKAVEKIIEVDGKFEAML